MSDLSTLVRRMVRQSVEGADAPSAQVRVQLADNGWQRSEAAAVPDRLPDRAPPPSMRVSFEQSGGARWRRPDRQLLDEVACAVRAELAAPDDADVEMELHVGAGRYAFRYHLAAADGPARPVTRVVLDPEYRYPGHPAPVIRPGPAPEPGPTDPQAMATVRELVNRFTAAYERSTGHPPAFGVGYSEDQLAAAEAAMGLRLPADLRALYRIVHDDLDEHGLLADQLLFPLEDVVAGYLGNPDGSLLEWPEYRAGLGTAVCGDDLFAADRVVLGGLPHDAVRRVSHDARWLTLGRNGGGRRFIAVDLDPGPAGIAGQLFCYEIGPSGWPVELVAGSVTALLRRFVDAAGGRDSTTPAWVHGAEEATYTGRPDGPWPVDSVTRLAAADDVQHCVLGGCPHIDLAGCAPLSRLRVLQVRDVQTVELALPHRVPVESLMVSAPAVDLTGLSGHPSIWDLTVSGTAAPVSIAPLATLPELARLDLSGVDVPDLELVVGLPRLRVLVLDAGQWARLRDFDAIPVGLAAAELAGNNTFEVETEWSAEFGVSAGPRRLLRGSL